MTKLYKYVHSEKSSLVFTLHPNDPAELSRFLALLHLAVTEVEKDLEKANSKPQP